MTSSRAIRAALLVVASTLACVTAFSSTSTAGAVPPSHHSNAEQKAADAALRDVRAIFTRSPDAGARAALPDGGVEASMALRDLALRADSLDPDDRAVAAAYLARPTDVKGDKVAGFVVKYDVAEAPPACSTDLCVHYVTTTANAPSLTDVTDSVGTAGANGVPDYVDEVLRVMTAVHDTYVEAGYREPRGDGARGGGVDLIDVYLAEIGTAGLYGYCTTDQPNPTGGPAFYDRWANCVLDDDYAGFANTPQENIEVTAAHEYFHATQYAYDAFEDPWFLEATATWAEDEVFDDVNDNVQYLRRSPLTAPFVPLDAFVGGGEYSGFHYGTWSFIRFLTEKYDDAQGTMPRLVLDMMEKVDGSLGAEDQYSWQAINSVLTAERSSAAEEFLAYSVANRRPRETYDEGEAQLYPTGPLRDSATLSPRKRQVSFAATSTDHLTSATYRLTPRKLTTSTTRLRLVLDLASTSSGSMAAVTLVTRQGKAKVRTIALDDDGDATKRVRFSSQQIKYVEVTLANTSARFSDCYRFATPYSCGGSAPRDDDQRQQLSARLTR
ncbi:MAG: MXAN_6640 family putative metalloprotease [Nocardioides sp.]